MCPRASETETATHEETEAHRSPQQAWASEPGLLATFLIADHQGSGNTKSQPHPPRAASQASGLLLSPPRPFEMTWLGSNAQEQLRHNPLLHPTVLATKPV